MLRAAARLQDVRGDTARRVGPFIRSRARPDGGFAGRGDASDLYYTVFALQSLAAIQPAAIHPAAEAAGYARPTVVHYLRAFADGASLDFVHLACLARCWALLDCAEPAPDVRAAILERLEAFRSPDRGYHQTLGAQRGTVYGAFLALGAYQDFQTPLPDPDGLVGSVRSLRSDGGGYANTPGLPEGSCAATAAAVVLLSELGQTVEPAHLRWLADQVHSDGGWAAMPGAPVADLLSTATAVHALAIGGAALDEVRDGSLAFVESLWSDEGGFRGHWLDDHLDCEYTFYGLLALGHLTG